MSAARETRDTFTGQRCEVCSDPAAPAPYVSGRYMAERASLSGEGRACPRSMTCQLAINHVGPCDPRDPEDRDAVAKGASK